MKDEGFESKVSFWIEMDFFRKEEIKDLKTQDDFQALMAKKWESDDLPKAVARCLAEGGEIIDRNGSNRKK